MGTAQQSTKWRIGEKEKDQGSKNLKLLDDARKILLRIALAFIGAMWVFYLK